MKYLVLLLPLLVMGCANKVEIEKKIEYKCGAQVMTADFLDDNSVIARIDGINYVLVRVATPEGRKFENSVAHITLTQNSGGTYLSASGVNYPMCQEVVR